MKTILLLLTLPYLTKAWNFLEWRHTKDEVKTFCRHETKELKCDSDETITITDVNFYDGRFQRCDDVWNPLDVCDLQISYKDLQDNCNGKRKCSAKMSYNPCTTTTLKFATILYLCTDDDKKPPIVQYPLIKVYNGRRTTPTYTQSSTVNPITGQSRPSKDEAKQEFIYPVGFGTALTALCLLMMFTFFWIYFSKRKSKKETKYSNTSRRGNSGDLFVMTYNSEGHTCCSQIPSEPVQRANEGLPSYEDATGPPAYMFAISQIGLKGNVKSKEKYWRENIENENIASDPSKIAI